MSTKGVLPWIINRLANALGIGIVLFILIALIAGLSVFVHRVSNLPEPPEIRVRSAADLRLVHRVALISFYTEAGLRRMDTVKGVPSPDFVSPEQTFTGKFHRSVETAKFLCAEHLFVWQIESIGTPLLELVSALKNPNYQQIDGSTIVGGQNLFSQLGLFLLGLGEAISCHEKLWVIPINQAGEYAWLVNTLKVDAVLVVANSYFIEFDVSYEKWFAVVKSNTALINREGKVIWQALNTGRSFPVAPEQPKQQVVADMILLMFHTATQRNWKAFVETLEKDIEWSREPAQR